MCCHALAKFPPLPLDWLLLLGRSMVHVTSGPMMSSIFFLFVFFGLVFDACLEDVGDALHLSALTRCRPFALPRDHLSPRLSTRSIKEYPVIQLPLLYKTQINQNKIQLSLNYLVSQFERYRPTSVMQLGVANGGVPFSDTDIYLPKRHTPDVASLFLIENRDQQPIANQITN